MKKKRILIDTDPAISIPLADIDDGLAIFLALNSPELNVEGLTTIFGNSNLDKVTMVARDLLRVANHLEIPIHKGAYNEKWLGVKTDASDFLINHITENPGEITLVALGPLTNLATAIKHKPEIVDDLVQIIIMGGLVFPERLKLGYPFITAEFNASKDPLSAKIVYSQSIKTIMVGLDVTTQVKFKDIHYVALDRVNTSITRYLKKYVKSWLIFNKLLMGGFHPHDPIALSYILNEKLFETIKLGLDIECNATQYKKIDKKYRMIISDVFTKKGRIKILEGSEVPDEKKIDVCVKVNKHEFMKLLLKRLVK